MAAVKKSNSRKMTDIPLKLECYDDELSSAQLTAYNKVEFEFNDALKKIESLIKKSNGNIVDQTDSTTIINFPTSMGTQLQQPVTISTGGSPLITNAGIVKSKVVPTSVSGLPSTTTLKPTTSGSLVALPQVASTSAGIVTTSNIQQGGTYQLVMDPRLGLLVSTVPQPTPSAGTAQVSLATSAPTQANTGSTVLKTSQASLTGPRRTYQASPIQKTTPTIQKPNPPNKVLASYNSNNQLSTSANPVKQKSAPATSTQSQNASQSRKRSATLIDLTDDEGKSFLADSREINFNNLSGKTFPSLVVVARPHLRLKDVSQSSINEERQYFNDRVKSVLMLTPTKFTEWLIQQGLVRSEHYCSTHTGPDNITAIKLKLGMYSDMSKFPYSGGYVWISDCCPQRYVSVYSGSIFEGAPHAPSVLLKLLYHWCSQTSVQNVLQWVKVEKMYVKTFYTSLRAVCTATICEKFEKLGGVDKNIEVGVISLGTTSADGSMRQVKVEVLGVMDPERKIIRLKAIEPVFDAERNVKKRFVKILEPLEQWIHKETNILTDNTVDKATLLAMGYKSIHQVSVHESGSSNYRNSNFHVMEYLRRVVPRMFQNTLSLLSRPIIQQFLDELVWRERWGHVPSKAFDAMIAHISEQTRLDSGETLTARLSKIAANPFRTWLYSMWFPVSTRGVQSRSVAVTPSTEPNAKRVKRKFTGSAKVSTVPPVATNKTPTPPPLQAQHQKPSSSPSSLTGALTQSAVLTSLEAYYYGSIPGNKDLCDNEKKCKLNMKCCSCRSVLPTNIQMMKHLIGHAFNEGAYGTETSKLPQCRYCLTNFVSDFCLQTHLEETHLKVASSLMCLICEEKFTDRTTLILHMHRTHTELELPYECNICGFRTSQHRLVVDHFYEVHNESEKVQCPYCLKTVAFSSNGRKVTQNLYFFLSHIQKHTRKTIARKCPKCALWFVHKGILKEHQSKYHSSCKDLPSVKRYSSTGIDTIMMPKPLAQGPLVEKHHIQRTKETLISNNFTANKFDLQISVENVAPGATCCECEGDMAGDDHYQGYLACLRCRFSTCCSKAMNEHLIVFHDPKLIKQYSVGKITILEKPMHCVCGFKSASGNKLAKHLALCNRKSAYPSAARAAQCTLQSQSASFPPLVTLDDQEDASVDLSDKWLQAFVNRKEKDEPIQIEKEKTEKPSRSGDPPSMLNVLGLVRKQSLDESSLDKPTSDCESGSLEASEVDLPNKKHEKDGVNNKHKQNESSTDMDVDDGCIDDVKAVTDGASEGKALSPEAVLSNDTDVEKTLCTDGDDGTQMQVQVDSEVMQVE